MSDAGPTGDEPVRAVPRGLRSAEAQIVALSVALAAASLVALLATPDTGSALRDGGPWVVLLVAAGFFVAEPLVFHIEARNEAVSFSPTDLPLAYGMLFVSPVALVVTRVVAGAVGLVVWRRQPPFKLALNVAVYAAETMAAVLLFRVLGPNDVAATPFNIITPWTSFILISLIIYNGSGSQI